MKLRGKRAARLQRASRVAIVGDPGYRSDGVLMDALYEYALPSATLSVGDGPGFDAFVRRIWPPERLIIHPHGEGTFADLTQAATMIGDRPQVMLAFSDPCPCGTRHHLHHGVQRAIRVAKRANLVVRTFYSDGEVIG